MALLKRARRLSDAAHAVGKVLTTTTAAASAVAATSAAAEAAASSTSTAQQVDDPLPATALLPKLLAAAPQELRPRLERAAAGVVGDTPGAEFAQTVLAALPRVEVVGVEEEEGEGREVGARRLRDTVAFVAVDGGLKDELFVELMAMMSHGWFARVWEGEGV